MAGVGMAGYVVGQTAVVVAVPEAEAVVQPWQRELTEAARFGVPPHVTVLFPFLPRDQLGTAELAALEAIVAAEPEFDVGFRACARFPAVLYLAPEPAEPFRRLTAALVRRWPQAQPYGGEFGADPTPHLTVAQVADPRRFDEIEAELVTRLPLRVRVGEVHVLEFDGDRWRPAHRLPLGRDPK